MSKNETQREITGLVLFFCGIALTLMYYLPVEITGVFGGFIRNIGFGLIGQAAILIPAFLFYAAVDFFMEKKEGVAPVRVRSVVVIIICVAALLAVCSMDFDYFATLTVDPVSSKAKATTAISLLWKSGADSALIKNPSSEGLLIPGGLIGGGIATAFNMVAGRTISILGILVFLVCQIIVIWQVSLKKVAKKTVDRSREAINRRRENQHRYVYTNHNAPIQNNAIATSRPIPVNNGQSPFVSPEVPVAPAQRPQRIGNTQYSTTSPYVNIPSKQMDPMAPRIPVDPRSGFTDVSAREFGADTRANDNTLMYGERAVSTQTDAPTADYSFTTMPQNPKLRAANKQEKELSFLKKEQKQDFMNLDDLGSNAFAPDPRGEIRVQTYPVVSEDAFGGEYVEDEGIYEVLDEEYPPEEVTPTVRESHVDMSRVMGGNDYYSGQMPIANNSISELIAEVIEEPVATSNVATINAATSVDLSEGRIIDTSSKPEEYIEMPNNTPAPKVYSKRNVVYKPAPINLLAPDTATNQSTKNDAVLREKAMELEETLKTFGIDATVVNITHGPAISRFEMKLNSRGTKVSKILGLQDDIALAMAAISVRIEAPIPGTSLIGIEIPNEKTSAVYLKGLLADKNVRANTSPLAVPLGRNISGNPIVCDLSKMPHLMIAGSTGSGKSVCINTILTSILCRATPDEVRLIMVDPKVVELSIYNGIPHLFMPVVTDAKKAAASLAWAVVEMERRYKLFAETNVRDIKGYNERLKCDGEKPLPLILIIIDELADLMVVAKKEVEDKISRLAAMARAAGLHLIIATQRPSVDVITGVIKANIPSRIAFAVSSGTDSRTILDSYGAEKLLGKGDMLYAPLSAPMPVRGQGAFVSDKEVEAVVNHLKSRYEANYDEAIIKSIENGVSGNQNAGNESSGSGASDEDDLFEQAVETVIQAGSASVSILQRRLGIGYPRAGKLIDTLERKRIIGPFEGSKPRRVLINDMEWQEMKARGND